jgi:acyl carrier protein
MNDLYKIISEVFEISIDGIKDSYGPDEIEKWDSLGQLSLVSSLESHYRTTFEIEEIFEIFTVADIKVLLAKRGIK